LSTDFAPADPNQRTPGHAGREYRRPLDRVFELGMTTDRRRVVSLVLAAAVAAHGGMAGAIRLRGEHVAVDLATSFGVEELAIEREILPPPPPPEPELPAPPPPEPPKVAAPMTAPAPNRAEEPEEPPASQAAEAGEILVQESDEDEGEDHEDDEDDNTFVTGHAESFAGGMTASAGSAVTAVRGPIIEKGGVPGGSGTRAVEAKPPAPDLSRDAWLEGSTAWDCDFPGEADRDRVDNAVVEMTVTVRPDGTAHSVSIVLDPGHGFARMASGCALKHKFAPAHDREGKPIWGTTRAFHVGFHR
jgi:periplasmic protein TonB